MTKRTNTPATPAKWKTHPRGTPPPAPPRAVPTPGSRAARRILQYVDLDNLAFADDVDLDIEEAVAYVEEVVESEGGDPDKLSAEFGAVTEDGALAIVLLCEPQLTDPVLLVIRPEDWVWVWEGTGTCQRHPGADMFYHYGWPVYGLHRGET